MMPIQELLHRIQWDPEFGKAEFRIGYLDRIDHEIRVVPLSKLHFAPDDKYSFELVDTEGALHTIPLHRVKEVYRNGRLIWNRKL